MNRLFSALVIIVLLLLLVAGGLYYYETFGHPGQPPSVATSETGPAAAVPGRDETAEARSGENAKPEAEGPQAEQPGAEKPGAEKPGAEEAAPSAKPETGKAALMPMPSMAQRPETITQYALTILPGWQSKIVTHAPDYRTATVRATSPDGKITLDVVVQWDKELGDFNVTDAEAAGAAKATAAVPKGIMGSLDANAKFKTLPDRRVSVKRLTSHDATIMVQSDIKKWQVYLKVKGGHWTIIKAREM
jgi:hypothetical protein